MVAWRPLLRMVDPGRSHRKRTNVPLKNDAWKRWEISLLKWFLFMGICKFSGRRRGVDPHFLSTRRLRGIDLQPLIWCTHHRAFEMRLGKGFSPRPVNIQKLAHGINGKSGSNPSMGLVTWIPLYVGKYTMTWILWETGDFTKKHGHHIFHPSGCPWEWHRVVFLGSWVCSSAHGFHCMNIIGFQQKYVQDFRTTNQEILFERSSGCI